MCQCHHGGSRTPDMDRIIPSDSTAKQRHCYDAAAVDDVTCWPANHARLCFKQPDKISKGTSYCYCCTVQIHPDMVSKALFY